MEAEISLLEVTNAVGILKTILQNLYIVGVFVNFTDIDWTASAIRAIKNERENGPVDEDNSAMGTMEKYARFASQAITFSGVPAYDFVDDGVNDAEAIRLYVKNRLESCAFWEEGGAFDSGDYIGKKQVRHSDLMVTSMSDIKVGGKYLQFVMGRPRKLFEVIKIEGDGERLRIMCIDWKTKDSSYLYAFCHGITPHPTTGLWNVVSWLESVDDEAVAEPKKISKSGLKECNWLKPIKK